MTLSETTANRINYYIFARNLTLYQLAKDSGLPIATLQNLYRGNSKSPTLSVIYKICRGLNISVNEFLSEEFFPPNLLEWD